MEIRILRYFLAIADEKNISRAADSLHMTQPTLSRQLINLENDLQTKLFTRSGRKMLLTEDGQRFRKRALDVIKLVDKMDTEFNTSTEAISGNIYIGSGETDGIRILAKIATNLREKELDIRYHLFSGNADHILDNLDKGLFDFGILIGPADIKKYDFIQLPTCDVWGVLMRKNDKLAIKNTIKPEDLWDENIIISSQSMVTNQLSGWMKKDFEKMNIVATYNLLFNASIMVEESLGYALCLDKIINTSKDSPLCFRPLEPSLSVNLNIVWKKHQIFSKPADLFLKTLHTFIES